MLDKNIENMTNILIQLDVDAIFIYYEAIYVIKNKSIKQRLKEFQADHERHVQELSCFLKNLGGKPIEPKQDIKGFFNESLTMLRSMAGIQGTLKALLNNEEKINQKYQEALAYKELPPEMQQLMVSNFHDEKRHTTYIKNKLEEIKCEENLS